MFFSNSNAPRWIIFLIDIIIVTFSVLLAYLLRFNFSIPDNELEILPAVLLYILFIRSISFLLAKTYAGIVRYTSTQDVSRIFIVLTAGSMIFVITNIITYYLIDSFNFIPYSIIIIDFFASTLAMIVFRILVKTTFSEIANPGKEKAKVIIFGAGELGIITKRALDRDAGSKYKILAFIDDNAKKSGKKLEGVSIHHSSKLDYFLETNTVAHVILSINKISAERKKGIIEKCLSHKTKVLNVPPVSNWINGELSFRQIRKIKIEDLLEREVIVLDNTSIRSELIGKTILITGAAGSIGSEISRQLCNYSPTKIILLDQSETPLYHLELELSEKLKLNKFDVVIADVCSGARMRNVFNTYKPDFVYHAAAYKHVPMMENNPSESLMTNIVGTKTVADLSVEFNVEKFIMISTDKAVNPTNIMGASKRIAEIYTQSLNQKQKTAFITTRFGNVLGSNGSVIPLFTKQIENGGPLTITHPEITRYFMTIPEACQLVLEAGKMGKGGEIFVFDMGKSVKIVDLAKKMIALSKLTLGKDIQIVYTGLRPGEKLYEELLNDEENTLPTYHPRIMIAKVREYEYNRITNDIQNLSKLFKFQDNMQIVSKMKEIVPEFKSKNSIFEKLDTFDS